MGIVRARPCDFVKLGNTWDYFFLNIVFWDLLGAGWSDRWWAGCCWYKVGVPWLNICFVIDHSSQQSLSQECGLFIDDLSSMSCRQPKSVDAYTPYLIKSNKDQLARNYLSQFSDHSVRHNLTELVLQYGGDATNALAGLYNKYGADFNVGMIGATASVHATRIDGFSKAVSEYQTAL